MRKIAIIGSRDLACKITHWIIENCKVDVIGGISPPFSGWWNDELKETFITYNIPIFEDINDLMSLNPDLILSINYWKKIDSEIIKRVPFGIVNIHHSYLLKYKGRYSTSWAIINARKLECWSHGTTMHYIDEKLDEGKIIDSWKCEIYETDTADILFQRVEQLAFEMVKFNFSRLLVGVDQYLQPDKDSFFYDKDSNILELNINSSPEDIYDFVRAWTFNGRPAPYFTFKGQKIRLIIDKE